MEVAQAVVFGVCLPDIISLTPSFIDMVKFVAFMLAEH
jgi:hypothetical protein